MGTTPAITRLGIPSLNMQDAVPFSSSFSFSFLLSKIQQPQGQGFRTYETSQIGQVTSWPCALALASTWNPALVYEWASAVAAEFRAKGANTILGPGLNVHRVARGGRNAEYMSGEDPYLGVSFAGSYVRGFQDNGVMTVHPQRILSLSNITNTDTHSLSRTRR